MESPEREAYITATLDRGCTDLTARTKNRYIDEFLRFCDEHAGHHRAKQVRESNIQAFAQHLYNTSWKWNTAHTKLSEVLGWLRWLKAEGHLKRDPGKNLAPGKMLHDLHDKHKRHVMEVTIRGKHREPKRDLDTPSADDAEWDDW